MVYFNELNCFCYLIANCLNELPKHNNADNGNEYILSIWLQKMDDSISRPQAVGVSGGEPGRSERRKMEVLQGPDPALNAKPEY